MWEDPIVVEVDRAREMPAAKFNFDVEAIFAVIRKCQAALGDRLHLQWKRRAPSWNWHRSHWRSFW